jgi:hypothetical protein
MPNFFVPNRSQRKANPVSANTIRRLEFCDQRLAPEIGTVAAETSENCGSETAWCRTNSRECRGYFREADMTRRDCTGWLGRQDSNLEMVESRAQWR